MAKPSLPDLGRRNDGYGAWQRGWGAERAACLGICAGDGRYDGTGGPSDAAGAIVDGKTDENALTDEIDSEAYLNDNDSSNFFRKAGGLFITGPTGSNVMDIQIVVII